MISETVHRRLLEKQYRAHLLIDKTYSSADQEPKPEREIIRKIMKPEYATMQQIADRMHCDRKKVIATLNTALEKMRRELTPKLIKMGYLDSRGNLL